MVQPHPESLLFPYTTLFRSLEIWNEWDAVHFLRLAEFGYSAADKFKAWFYPFYPWCVEFIGRAEAELDRKSTRLNSSHVSISYAVFCLKKKKDRKITRLNSS